MTRIDFTLAPLGKDCRYAVDGVDISKAVRSVSVDASVDQVTTVLVEYICRDGTVHVEGTVKSEDVEHYCPVNGRLGLAYDRDGDTATWLPIGETFIDRGNVRRKVDTP